MSERKSQQQRNDKKQRKLIRSPEKLSPCELDPIFNPSFLSTTVNIFAGIQSSQRSSSTKSSKEQIASQHQQVRPNTNLPVKVDHPTASCSTYLPPSSSAPVIALHRKPSITIKHIKTEEEIHDNSSHEQISKSSDAQTHPFTKSLSTTEHADQTSNNFLINFNNVPGCCLHNSAKLSPTKQQHHQQSKNLSSFCSKDEISSSSVMTMTARETCQQIFAHQSLNLNLATHSNPEGVGSNQITRGQMVFNSNNPFLSDTFDAITAHEEDGDVLKLAANFFNVDENSESESLNFSGEVTMRSDDAIEEQLLKNKREKFSNASTMKICLVVSPPTNKLFQVSI